MKFCISCVLCVFMTVEANSQSVKTESQQLLVKGTLIDSISAEPLPYATIALITKPDNSIVKGVISQLDGTFEMKFEWKEVYSLVIQHLGYKTVNLDIKPEKSLTIDLGLLALVKSPVLLKETTVKPIIVQTPNEIIYNIDQDPDRKTASIAQILEKIPLVEMKPDGGFYIESPEKTHVLTRNGRSDAFFSGDIRYLLKNLPALGYKQIKITSLPGLRHEGTDYVVDFVADKSVKVVGAVWDTNSGYMNEMNHKSVGQGIRFSSEKIRGTGSMGVSSAKTPLNSDHTELTTFSPLILTLQKTSGNSKSQSGSGSLKLSIDLASNQFLTLEAKSSKFNSESITFKELAIQNVNKTNTNITQIEKERKNQKYEYSVNYQYEFKKPERILNLVSRFSVSPEKSDVARLMINELGQPFETGNNWQKKRITENRVQLFYLDKLSKKTSLESSLGWMNRVFYSEADFFIRDSSTNILYRDLPNYNLLNKKYHYFDGKARLKTEISKTVTLAFDLNLEYLNDGKGAEIIRGAITNFVSETGFTINPSINSFFLVNKKRVNISYGLRQSRPSFDYLNPYNEDPNGLFIKTGNPALKKINSNHISFVSSYKVKKISIPVNFHISWSNNALVPFSFINDKNQSVTSYSNQGKRFGLGFSNSLMLRTKNNRVTQSLNISTGYTKMTYPGNLKSKSYSLQTYGTTTLGLSKTLSAIISESFVYSNNSGYAYSLPKLFNLYVSVTQQFLKGKIWVSVQIRDVFNYKYGIKSVFETKDYRLTSYESKVRYPISFSVFVNFGKFKVKPVKNTKKRAEVNDLVSPE